MKRRVSISRPLAIAGLVVFVGCTTEPQPEPSRGDLDISVTKVYEPLVVAAPLAASQPVDEPVPDIASTADVRQPDPDNPPVEPGLVDWHASLDDACSAARESGRPVLLFHLMGNLDQRFT